MGTYRAGYQFTRFSAVSRRELLLAAAGTLGPGSELMAAMPAVSDENSFVTRGIVLTPEDLSLEDWPERAKRAGLTTIALHPTPSAVMAFVQSARGDAFLDRCASLGLEVEYELHAMSELLPRELFEREPSMFRMDDAGRRVREHNLCVHSKQALETVADNAARIAWALQPTTGRYFLWGDDAAPWCRCPKCRELSDSDQALLLANHLASVLAAHDGRATVAHLAYHNTLLPPTSVKPAPKVFLEFAPIHRRHDVPFEQQRAPECTDTLEALEANLKIFGAAGAQVLEYWLDLSRFAGWKKPAPRLPWSAPVVAADLDAYGSRGIRHVTSFGVFLDAAYLEKYGEPPLGEYGALLRAWRPRRWCGRSQRRREPEKPSVDSLTDPYRRRLLEAGARMPEIMEACAEPLHGEPAFDPARIWHIAANLTVPGIPETPLRTDEMPLRQLLVWSIRVGLAHIEATFQGDHPKYGVGAYAAPEHDGFPPTIIAAVDALTQWGMIQRAEALMGYWLRTFVADDGSIRYYAPSISEYGQLLTTVRRLLQRGGSVEWLSRHVKSAVALVRRVLDWTGGATAPRLVKGVPEADTASDEATYFHNNAWLWRGLMDWSWILEKRLRRARESEAIRLHGLRLKLRLLEAVRDTWPRSEEEWWLKPMVEAEGEGTMARPVGRITASRLGSYTNYRYWPELLSSGALPEDLMRRVVRARLSAGGQWLGMTRFEDHADDWTLADYLEGLWTLRMRNEYRYVLWGHILYHQARGHLTAFEQVSLPPGRKVADYCLPCQLVAARAAKRVL